MRWPLPFARALDGARAAERRVWLVVAGVAALAVVAFVAIPLQDAITHKRDDVVRSRLILDVARARAAENLNLARATVPDKTPDLRATVDRILTAQGVRSAPLETQTADDARKIVIDAVPFADLVRTLDALAHAGVRVVDATLAARVDPGTVRAELSLAR